MIKWLLIISYITAIDTTSRWPEAFPINDTTSLTVAKTLWSELISRGILPSKWISDGGPCFIGSVLKELSTLTGFKQMIAQPYSPHTNGDVEQFHNNLKQAFTKVLQGHAENWKRWLPAVLLAFRTTPCVPSSNGLLTPLYCVNGIYSPLIPKVLQTPVVASLPTADELVLKVDERIQHLSALVNLVHPEISFLREQRLGVYKAITELKSIKPLSNGTLVLLLKPIDPRASKHSRWASRVLGVYRTVDRCDKGSYLLETIQGEKLETPVN